MKKIACRMFFWACIGIGRACHAIGRVGNFFDPPGLGGALGKAAFYEKHCR